MELILCISAVVKDCEFYESLTLLTNPTLKRVLTESLDSDRLKLDCAFSESIITHLEFTMEFQSNQLIYQKEYTKRQQTIYHLKEFEQYASSRNNITLHINSNSIAQLMNNANFAIMTPSVTINEILYLGIPFIAIQTAENQNYMSDFIKKHNHQILKKFSKKELKYSLKKFT
jgi:hypothetical protein